MAAQASILLCLFCFCLSLQLAYGCYTGSECVRILDANGKEVKLNQPYCLSPENTSSSKLPSLLNTPVTFRSTKAAPGQSDGSKLCCGQRVEIGTSRNQYWAESDMLLPPGHVILEGGIPDSEREPGMIFFNHVVAFYIIPAPQNNGYYIQRSTDAGDITACCRGQQACGDSPDVKFVQILNNYLVSGPRLSGGPTVFQFKPAPAGASSCA
ncbi:uncharacterized protein VTP21DRAFT_5254 [Calcarisporiella thermophila]|uniref:uncharacterized protein n=1 Tax=Calcarisporiella thermophila TaxID=911321 RepID=UPI0037430516